MFRGDARAPCNVEERPQGARHQVARAFLEIFGGKVRPVEAHALRRLAVKPAGHGEVVAVGNEVGKVMDVEGGFVGEGGRTPGVFGPEGDLDEALTYLDFPSSHQRYIKSTNVLERLFRAQPRGLVFW